MIDSKRRRWRAAVPYLILLLVTAVVVALLPWPLSDAARVARVAAVWERYQAHIPEKAPFIDQADAVVAGRIVGLVGSAATDPLRVDHRWERMPGVLQYPRQRSIAVDPATGTFLFRVQPGKNRFRLRRADGFIESAPDYFWNPSLGPAPDLPPWPLKPVRDRCVRILQPDGSPCLHARPDIDGKKPLPGNDDGAWCWQAIRESSSIRIQAKGYANYNERIDMSKENTITITLQQERKLLLEDGDVEREGRPPVRVFNLKQNIWHDELWGDRQSQSRLTTTSTTQGLRVHGLQEGEQYRLLLAQPERFAIITVEEGAEKSRPDWQPYRLVHLTIENARSLRRRNADQPDQRLIHWTQSDPFTIGYLESTLVEIRERQAQVTLSGLIGNQLELRLGGARYQIDLNETEQSVTREAEASLPSIDDLLDPDNKAEWRPAHVPLEPKPASALQSGLLYVWMHLPERFRNRKTRYIIKVPPYGDRTIAIPTGSTYSIDPDYLHGWWWEFEKHRVSNWADDRPPQTWTAEALPAGIIHGTIHVQRPADAAADPVEDHDMQVSFHPLDNDLTDLPDTYHIDDPGGVRDGRFISSPVILGTRCMVFGAHKQSATIFGPVTISASNPVIDVDLHLAESGTDIDVIAVDDHGQQIAKPDAQFRYHFKDEAYDLAYVDHITCDDDGVLRLREINTDLPGHYQLDVRARHNDQHLRCVVDPLPLDTDRLTVTLKEH